MAPRSRSPGATTAPRRVTPVVPPTEVTHGEACAAYAAACRGCPMRRRRRCRPRPRPAARARGRRCTARPWPAFAGAVDGEVQHVDPVGDRPVDGGDEVGRRAAVVARVGGGPAGLVDGQPGLRGRAGVEPGTLARDPHVDPGVAGGDRRHQGAVTVVVERGETGAAADAVGAEPLDEPVRRRRSCGHRPPRPSPARRRTGPRKSRAARPRPRTSANSGLSGHRPESTSPITTPGATLTGQVGRGAGRRPAGTAARRRTESRLDATTAGWALRAGGPAAGVSRTA